MIAAIYRFLAWSLLILAGICGILRATAIRWWQVPSSDQELATSAAPGVAAGDWVLLWRLTSPSLGSLALCPDPDEPQNVVLGRIVARGNELVTIDKGTVYVNLQPLPVEANCTDRKFTVTNPETGEAVELSCDLERVANVLHPRVFGPSNPTERKFEMRVPRGKVFLLSDNRAFPFDSRHFGAVPESSCSETVFFRIVGERGFFDVARRLTYLP